MWMTRLAIAFSLAAFAPLSKADPADWIDKSLEYKALSQVEVSADAAWAAFVATHADLDENAQNSDVWAIELETERSFQLTRGPKRDDSPQWSPSENKLAFISDRKDRAAIWLISPDGGEAEQVTKFEKLAVESFQWLPDGSGFVFVAADPDTDEQEKDKKDKRDTIVVDEELKYARLYRFRLGDEEPELLTEADVHVTRFDLSPDGAAAVFAATQTPKADDRKTADLKLLDLGSKAVTDLVRQPGPDTAPRFSPDGQWVAFSSASGVDDPVANSLLYRIRSTGGTPEVLTPRFDEHAGTDLRWAAAGRSIYFTARDGVAGRLMRLTVDAKQVERVSDYDADGEAGPFALSPSGLFAVASFSTPTRPQEIYRVDRNGTAKQLTTVNSAFQGWAPRTERFDYESADGWKQRALLLRPPEPSDGPLPLLVIVHGGPAGVHGARFSPARSAWPYFAFLDQGYALFFPNPRGSTGFGEEFRKAVVADWGGGDFRDIMRGVDLLVERGIADPDRMGVMGWSYGGYMTAWTVTQTDRFKAASVGAGITNAISMYGTQDIPDFFETHFGGLKPWEDPEKYLRHSAIRFVAQAKTPTLIQHGAQDRRVPVGQAQEFHLALKKVGVESRLVLYPRQGHGISEPRLHKDAMRRSLNWFNEKVLGIAPPNDEPVQEP